MKARKKKSNSQMARVFSKLIKALEKKKKSNGEVSFVRNSRRIYHAICICFLFDFRITKYGKSLILEMSFGSRELYYLYTPNYGIVTAH